MPETRTRQPSSRGADGPWWASLALDALMFLFGLLVGLLLTAGMCGA